MGNSLIVGYIKTEELEKLKAQHADYTKKSNECIENLIL